MEVPITQQPLPPSYFSITHGNTTNIPEDLLYLNTLTEVRVYQQLDKLDAFQLRTAFDRSNRYIITNDNDEAFLFAKEISDVCPRICACRRPMVLDFVNDGGKHVLKLNRPFRCCVQEMNIEFPPGNIISTVKESLIPLIRRVYVQNTGDNNILTIKGQWFGSRCCKSQTFKIIDKNDKRTGSIKKYSESCAECMAVLNDFKILYADEVNVIDKLKILGSAFLIDMTYGS